MNDAIHMKQDARSTLAPARWLEIQIYGWESGGWDSQFATVRHTRLRVWRPQVGVDVERSFDETFDLTDDLERRQRIDAERARWGHD